MDQLLFCKSVQAPDIIRQLAVIRLLQQPLKAVIVPLHLLLTHLPYAENCLAVFRSFYSQWKLFQACIIQADGYFYGRALVGEL